MRYKCTLMYDGTNFHGFQIQEDLRTVQLEIENVLKIITKENTKIYAAGRTDTKVHALGKEFAEQHNMIFYETSAKTGAGVKELFQAIATKEYEIINENK